MASPKSCSGSLAHFPPPYLSGDGVDKHAIEIRSKFHQYIKSNQLDESILHMIGNTLLIGPHWFEEVP